MRLVKGDGGPGKGACWMAAIHYYTRRDNSWSDHPRECVSEVVRPLAIRLNDMCSDGEREELIGPHLWAPVGTATGPEDEARRAYLCADRAARVWVPRALDAAGLVEDAARLRGLPPIVDAITAHVAAAAAYNAGTAAANAAFTAANPVYTAAAYTAFTAANAAYNAAYAAAYDAIAHAADSAAIAAGAAKAELLDLILECCAIGTRADVCATKTREEVIREACT